MNPKCPDCDIELEIIDDAFDCDNYGREYPVEPYCKCPKCKQEYNSEDVE